MRKLTAVMIVMTVMILGVVGCAQQHPLKNEKDESAAKLEKWYNVDIFFIEPKEQERLFDDQMSKGEFETLAMNQKHFLSILCKKPREQGIMFEPVTGTLKFTCDAMLFTMPIEVFEKGDERETSYGGAAEIFIPKGTTLKLLQGSVVELININQNGTKWERYEFDIDNIDNCRYKKVDEGVKENAEEIEE